jgi:hypothetical protein
MSSSGQTGPPHYQGLLVARDWTCALRRKSFRSLNSITWEVEEVRPGSSSLEDIPRGEPDLGYAVGAELRGRPLR